MFLTMCYTAVVLTPPLALRYLIDHVVTAQRWQLLGFAVGAVVLLPLCGSTLALLNRFLIAVIGQRLIVDLRSSLYRHILQLNMKFHGEVGAGTVMSRMMTDVGMVQSLITGETLGMIGNIVALIFSVAMAIYLNWILGLVLLVMVVLYTLNYYKFAMRIRQANLELREVMDEVTGHLQERIAGVRLVKIYNRERDETGAFLASTDRALRHGMRGAMLNVSLSASARLISGIGLTVIYCTAVWFILAQYPFFGRPMTFGDLLALEGYLNQAIMPAVSLTMVAGVITQAVASLDRILDLLSHSSDIADSPDAHDLPDDTAGDLRLEDVHFAYQPDEPLFQGLSLHMPAGRMTAFVGRTGCGKTTVTSLLMRLWDVQDGRVTIDGHDVREITLRSLRRHVGVVPQEPVVFEGTVFANIAYAQPEATQEEVEEAARAAQIHEYVTTLPEGYQTLLGKEGAKLSSGQKQRIAIARAILRKPAVLILDEATSALDSESEAALQEAMRTILRGRTSVVVAHRLSTIVEADQIIAMDKGRVVEIGTHETLMRIEGGYYRGLYEEMRGAIEQEVAIEA
jgi:subfamily B ATP-binding cassette protein MsbA